MNTISIRDSIRWGWNTFKMRPWFFIGTYLTVGIVNGRFSFQTSEADSVNMPLWAILVLVLLGLGFAALQNIIGMGEKKILLKAHADVQSAKITDLWTIHPFWRFLFTNILYGLILVAGFLLLIIPGVIWSLQFMFAPLIVMDKGSKPIDALKESSRITRGHKWSLFKLSLAIIAINILGLLCLVVGLLVSMPVSMLAVVHAYRTLSAANAAHV